MERLPRAEELLPAKLLKRIEELPRESKVLIDFLLQRSHSGCCCSKVFILIKDMRRPKVEVFSVRINHIDGVKLYGTITGTDGQSSESIYNRSRDHYESISPGQTALLTGPARCISACDSFTIDVALKDKDKLSPDDDVSSEQIPWNVYNITNKYDEPLYEDVPGKNGSVTVNYVVFRNAVGAIVEVTLVNRGGENSAHVYGLLTARNGNFMNESVLFRKKSDDEHVDVRPEQPIPLSRSVVAVPSNSSLIVWAALMDHHGEIAKGTAEFPAQHSGTSQKNIFGEHGEIRVEVNLDKMYNALYAVQFHLFVTCVLFLSREGFWRACMRADIKWPMMVLQQEKMHQKFSQNQSSELCPKSQNQKRRRISSYVSGSSVGHAKEEAGSPVSGRCPEKLEVRKLSNRCSEAGFVNCRLVVMAFGPSYSYSLIRLLCGQKWSDGEASTAVQYYCLYVITLAMNVNI
ncbi:unnamed protein product [Camellia sinensis]